MLIPRESYISKLIGYKDNGRVKIITGIRRCGKSFLLSPLYTDYLKSNGVKDDEIIVIELEKIRYARYRNPILLSEHLASLTADQSKRYYVMLDEIQKVEKIKNPYLPETSDSTITFVDVVLDLIQQGNVDVYITGSNSRMLSSDVATEFRDRGDEIAVWPLSYKEFHEAFTGDKRDAWPMYQTYGGMPYAMTLSDDKKKSKYLKDLFKLTYIRDVIERNSLGDKAEVLDDLLKCLASAIGSLTNPTRLANTLQSVNKLKITAPTISRYIDFFEDAFILRSAERYDVKGRNYIGTPKKYYMSDVGLRNALLNFRQHEENHIMENIIYNELVMCGYNVDVGIVEHRVANSDDNQNRVRYEIDFVCNRGDERVYIQSALTIAEREKQEQEMQSLLRVDDNFLKIIVVGDRIIPHYDDNGIYYINVEDFLLDYIYKM